MLPVLLVLAALAGIVALVVLFWHGSAHATAQGSWPVAGWAYVEVPGPGGTVTVHSPELDELQQQRWAHEEETDPQLERWALGELDEMDRALRRALEEVGQ